MELIDVPEQEPWFGLAQFHSNETQSMLLRFQQIENLLSLSHHSGSEGNFCEHLVRTFLRDTLPARFSIDTGFILGTATEVPWVVENELQSKSTSASPQLDIIVHDADNYAPVLRTGEFVIVLPDAVHGVIEVKKNLNSGNLDDALLNLATTRHLVRQWNQTNFSLFTGIFAFGCDDGLIPQSTGQISKTYENRLNEICTLYPPAVAVPEILLVASHIFFGRSPSVDNNEISMPWAATNHNNLNISGQILLWHLMKKLNLPEINSRIKRFQWPDDLPFGGELRFANPTITRPRKVSSSDAKGDPIKQPI